MKIWSALTNAVAGWQLILQSDASWRDRFTLSAAGLGTALAIFAFVAFLAVIVASLSIGMPSIVGVIAAMFVLALPVTALVVVLVGTRMALGSTESIHILLVPSIYALIAFVILEAIVAMIGGPVIMLSWIALGYLLYRLARLAADWNFALAIGFAVLTVLLLVGLRVALYMLTSAFAAPI